MTGDSKIASLFQKSSQIYESLSACITECLRPFVSSRFDRIMYIVPATNNSLYLEDILIEKIAKNLNKDIVINNVDESKVFGKMHKFGTFIIYYSDQTNLQHQINMLKVAGSLTPYAKFLLYSPIHLKNRSAIKIEISKYLWSENILDSVIILPEAKLSATFDVTAWNPYKNQNCGLNFEERSHTFEKCSFGAYKTNVELFNKKVPKKFEQCEIKVHYYKRPPYVISYQPKHSPIRYLGGIEIKLITTVAEILNLKIIYPVLINDELGGIDTNNTFTGAFKSLETKELDVAIGGYAKTPKVAELLDSTRAYIQDSVIWCVPRVSATTNIEKISVITPFTLMMILLIPILISLLINYLSRKDKNEIRWYASFGNTFFEIITIFLSSPVQRIPKTHRVRRFFALYLFFSFIFSIVYTSSLTSHLTNPFFKEKYSSIRAIYKNNLKTYIAPGYLFLLSNIEEIDGVPKSEIIKRLYTCYEINKCLRFVAYNKDSSFCLPQTYINYYSTNEMNKNIFCLSDSKITYNVNMVMRKGFPLSQQIDRIISRLINGGFIMKWKFDTYPKKNISMVYSKTVKSAELFLVCQIHCITLVLWILVFFVEIIVYKKYKRVNKNDTPCFSTFL